MAALFDIAEIGHRAAAAGSRWSAAAQDERARNAKLSDVLEAVETTLVSQRESVQGLEKHQKLALSELRHLSDVLHDTQVGPPRLLWRLLYPKSFADRAELIGRLDAVISTMSRDGEKGGEEIGAIGWGVALGRNHSGKIVGLFTLTCLLFALSLAGVKFYSGAVSEPFGQTALARQSESGSRLAAGGAPGVPVRAAEQSNAAMVAAERGLASTQLQAGAAPGMEHAPQPGVPRHEGAKQSPTTLESVLAAAKTVMTPRELGQTAPPLPARGVILQRTSAARPNRGATSVSETTFAAALFYSADKEVSLLLSHADRQIAALALTTPEDDNAYKTYQMVLSLQPNNQAAFDGIERIGLTYLELANLAAAKGDLPMASHYASKAKEFAPAHPAVRAMAGPVDSVEPMSGDETSAAVTVTRPEASRQTAIEGKEAVNQAEAVLALPPSAADESLTEGYNELLATFQSPQSREPSLSQDLDTEILEMSPLVVPVYPGEEFAPPNSHNERDRSHDRDVARARAKGSGNSGSGGNGSGGSGSGGNGSGGNGSGGSGSGGSGSGGSGSGGGDSGGGNGNGNGGGNGSGGGGNGGNNGNGGGNGNGNGNGNGRK